VMFSSVKAHHATLCKIRQAVAATGAGRAAAAAPGAGGGHYGAAPSDSDWRPPSIDINGNDNGSKGRKRKQQQSYDTTNNNNLFPLPPVSKSRFSRDSSHRSGSLPSHQTFPELDAIKTTNGDYYQYDSRMQAPLSPMLAAAAANRQGRSAPSRERRRQLAYLPNQDLEEPLILNRSPVRVSGGGRTAGGGGTGDPVPLRLASQNSEELKNRTGSGPIAAALPSPQQPQQQQAPRVLTAHQAQQVYQHIQQMRAAQASVGGVAVAAAGAQQQQRSMALPPQFSQQFVAQLQYAQQIRQQQMQQQQQAAGGRGPGAPVLQGGGVGSNAAGNGTFIPINGLHQAFNPVNAVAGVPGTAANAVPAVMYHQFGTGFVPVQQTVQRPTGPQ
jgi:hypothetical protein